MAIEGSLDLFRLPEILQVISQENKTGILTVQGERDIIAISFSNGRVVAADALNQTLEEALGDTLDRENLLARSEYEAAVAEQRSSGGRLIDILVDRGYLDRSELLAGLRRHTSDLLSDVLVWEEGDFKFYTNDEVSYEEGFEPISVEGLLLANLDEAQLEDHGLQEDEGAAAETLTPVEPLPATTEPAPLPEAEPASVASAPAADLPRQEEPGLRTPAAPSPAASAAPTAEPRVRPAPRVARVRDAAAPEWIPRLLGAAAAVGVVIVFLVLPTSRILVPLPFSAPSRAALEQTHREAWLDHVGGAVHSFQLLEGRLPENPGLLAQRDLLTRGALDTDVGTWQYEPGPGAFRLSLDGAAMERSIRGDFLLDPDFLVGSQRQREPPLVLLD